MINAEDLKFAEADITRQALVQSSALTYLMVAYAIECGQTPDHVAAFAGRLFAKGWARFADEGAIGIVRHMALIVTCIGGEVLTVRGDATEAEMRSTGVVTTEDARFFGITRDDADHFCNVFGPMTAELGYLFSWLRDGDDLIYRVRVRSEPESS